MDIAPLVKVAVIWTVITIIMLSAAKYHGLLNHWLG